MTSNQDILSLFEKVRRAQRQGQYAPHKPLLILLALARLQRGEPRLVKYQDIDLQLKELLRSFGPSSAPSSRHYPFWHLRTDADGSLWDLQADAGLLDRPPAATPNLGELKDKQVHGGFSAKVDTALRQTPGLIQTVVRTVLASAFPETLHEDIIASLGLDLSQSLNSQEGPAVYDLAVRRRRNPAFRERVLLAYEYRCCVCGFDLKVCHLPAGLEAAHIHWHTNGGPDVETNGLALCALHHKLFDLGAFTIEPTELRVIYSQHAIASRQQHQQTPNSELRHHGVSLKSPQAIHQRPAPEHLSWNLRNVFKGPARPI